VKLIAVRNKTTKKISHVSEEWLERWPADFTRVEPTDPPKETPKPATGTNKKESSK
jgi:hypothetical protein